MGFGTKLARGLRTAMLGALTSLVVVAVLASTAVGTTLAVRKYTDEPATGVRAATTTSPATPTTTPTTTPITSSRTTPTPTPPVTWPDGRPAQDRPQLLTTGARGVAVREVQHRLFQAGHHGELTTGTFDADTLSGLQDFQRAAGLAVTGVLDAQTHRRLLRITSEPTADQLHNVLRPGPALLAAGSQGDQVRRLQHRLHQLEWWSSDITDNYGSATVEAVRGFQAKRQIPVTGEVDQRTMDRLVAMTREPTYDELHNVEPAPGALDARCLTGRALCVDKSSQTLRWVVDGKVVKTFDARFGSDELPTREGSFSVTYKSRDHVSSLYDTPMPFAMFFSHGQAVHYSPDFAASGYNGASHGCVNIRDLSGITWLFDQVGEGDRVIVYWS